MAYYDIIPFLIQFSVVFSIFRNNFYKFRKITTSKYQVETFERVFLPEKKTYFKTNAFLASLRILEYIFNSF